MKEHLPAIALDLLAQLITIPSFSKEEEKAANLIQSFCSFHQIETHRTGNNVWMKNLFFDPAKPTLLLNSHHDTVKPNSGYSQDPFEPKIEQGKIYGLGSNDAGGPLVSLICTFLYFYRNGNLRHNLVLAATAEEEISGEGGIEKVWNELPPIDFAIVGEPTKMEVAIAEKGLLVLDCVATGKAGHAAREEGINAIYQALPDIEWFRTFRFPKTSETLGEIKMSVTMIDAGTAHNQVPPQCKFTVDVRVTDACTLEEVLGTIQQNVSCSVTPRSLRLRPSGLSKSHPLYQTATKLNKTCYGSPTTSDQALIPVPSIKMGPGDSARSHSADEFIFLHELEQGVDGYIHFIENLAI